MGRLMPLIGERLTDDSAVGARILGWEGDVSPAGQSVPLRTAGALHALVLDGTDARAGRRLSACGGGRRHALVRGGRGVHGHEAPHPAALDRAPQTNEIRRSAILLPALWWLLDKVGDLPSTCPNWAPAPGST
jgi:hypothetical protein